MSSQEKGSFVDKKTWLFPEFPSDSPTHEKIFDGSSIAPKDVKPKIAFASSSEAGDMSFKAEIINPTPLEISAYEVANYRLFIESTPGLKACLTAQTPEECQSLLLAVIVESIGKKTSVSEEQIKSVFGRGFLLSDLVWFYQQVLELTGGLQSTTQQEWMASIVQSAVYVQYPSQREVLKVASPAVLRLLSLSRLLGLVPLSVVHELRQLPIHVIGASAASQTIQLLARLGAERLVILDDGKADPAKEPTMNTTGISGAGKFKATNLLQALYEFNPFGNFTAQIGRVKQSEQAKQSDQDVTLEEFIEYIGANGDVSRAGVVLEVADSPEIKLAIRQFLEENYPNLIVLAVADTQTPYATIERPGDGLHFNRDFTEEDFHRIANPSQVANTTKKFELLRSVSLFLGDNLPTEHQATFLLFLEDILPFWPQTPIAAMESAAIAGKLLIAYIQEQLQARSNSSVSGRDVSVGEAPQSFLQFSEEERNVANLLMKELLQLPN